VTAQPPAAQAGTSPPHPGPPDRAGDLGSRGSRLLADFRDKARQQPLLFLGAALATGLVAGGAIAPRVLARIVRIGGGLAWRLVALPLIKERILAAVEGSQVNKED
jgi:hypothetical protein